MRIVVATVQVPFVQGGAEMHAAGLCRALIEAGHEAEIVALPFKWYPPERILDQILAARLYDLTGSFGTSIDRVIGLRFPAYFVPHPNKVLWVLHQHRTAYELWDTELCDLIHFPNGLEVRDAIRAADRAFLPEARAVYANSRNVSARLKRFCGIDSQPLYHPPPGAELFRTAPAEDFLFFPSRINGTKRQLLVIEALAHCRQDVRVRFAGTADEPAYERQIADRTAALGLGSRVELVGQIDDERKREYYARCLGVIFPPVDEDYGYVTLEAMLARKPVIACTDSGGPLEFVQHAETGLVVEPTAGALAEAMDRLWSNRSQAKKWGEAGRELYQRREISWAHVVDVLTRDA